MPQPSPDKILFDSGLKQMYGGRQWCLKQARGIGPSCTRLIEILFVDRVLDNLRAAQGIIHLGDKYVTKRLEAASRRALFYDNPRYGTVKSILKKGLDQLVD